MNYTHDESDIYWSVAGIEQTLEHMLGLFGAGNFDVVGHSMGTRGTFLALMRMSKQHSGTHPLLNSLVLLAADIDAGIFSQYIDESSQFVNRIIQCLRERTVALNTVNLQMSVD